MVEQSCGCSENGMELTSTPRGCRSPRPIRQTGWIIDWRLTRPPPAATASHAEPQRPHPACPNGTNLVLTKNESSAT